MKKFLIGPFVGDFLHALYVVKDLSDNEKSDVYLTETVDRAEIGFSRGLNFTYNDLYPIIIKQPYINKFLIYDHTNPIENIIDLRQFLYDHSIIYKMNWYDTFKKLFNTSNKYEKYPWLSKIDDDNYKSYENKVIINFSIARYDNNFDQLIENILKNNDCLFISSKGDLSGYEKFKFKKLLPVKECDSFSEIYSIIEHCKFFVGNQSMPLAVAHCTFKPHLGFLYKNDAIHYKDHDINKNYFWFDSKKRTSHTFNDIYNHINLYKMEIESVIIDYDKIKFDIDYDIEQNRVFISCNSHIEVSVLIYEYRPDDKIIVVHDRILTRAYIKFNKGTIFFETTRPMKNMDYIRVEIKDHETYLKNEIIKMEKQINFDISYKLNENRVYISCDSNVQVFVTLFDDKNEIINHNSLNFTKNIFWLECLKPMKNMKYVKIQIKDTDKILKEEIIKI